MNGDAPVKHLLQRAVRCSVCAGALVHHAASGHHNHLLCVQRDGDFMQHADHRLARRPPARAPAPASRPGAVGPGWPAARPSAAPGPARPARGPAARAGARRPTVAPSARSRQSQAWVARSASSTAEWSAALGDASQGWCGRRPSMATSKHGQVIGATSFWPSQASCCARARMGSAASGWPSSVTLCAVGQQPGQHFQQRGFAGAIGADDAGPASLRQG
jgi:hypothetical protein